LDTPAVVKERVPSNRSVIVGIVKRKRSIPNTGVSVANYIARECAKSGGYVFGAGGIDKKRLGTVGRALVAADIAEERFIADRGVLVANGVAKERFETNGHVPDSASEAEESVSALCRVRVSIASVRWRVNCLKCRRKRKPAERDQQHKKAATRRRAADGLYYVFHFLIHFSLMLPCYCVNRPPVRAKPGTIQRNAIRKRGLSFI
jgi:hypothetical protein